MQNFLNFRLYLTLVFFSGCIIVNSAFMLLRVPPVGVGIPVSEIILVLFFLSIGLDLKFFRAFRQARVFPFYLVWLFLGVGHLLVAAPREGLWAIRDAAHWMQSNYLWIGYVLASRPDFFAKFATWFRRTLDLAIFYFLLYPFRVAIEPYLLRISSPSGYTIPLLFFFSNSNALATVAGFNRLLIARYTNERFLGIKLTLGVISVAFLVLFLQARITYLELGAVVLLLAFIRPGALSKLGMMGVVGVIFVAIVLSLDLNLPGRLGEQFSLEFLINHIQAIWGGGDARVRDAAAGVDLRIHWWLNVLDRVNAHWWNSLFGLGFGEALTDFRTPSGAVVREVHNSFVSVYGRMGPIGLICFLAFHFYFFTTALKLITKFKALGQWRLVAFVGGMLGMMTMQMLFSMVEGGFEVTYVAVPYYFMGGVLVALRQRVDTEGRTSETRIPAG